MMKQIKYIVFILTLCTLLSACSHQRSNIDDATVYDNAESSESSMPLHFDDERQLIKLITKAKMAKNNVSIKNDDTFNIASENIGSQEYNIRNDRYDLKSVSEYYKPTVLLAGFSFSEILVSQTYISFYYENEQRNKTATFTWLRGISPEIAMNDLYGRGAVSEYALKYKGIHYVILEWPDADSGLMDSNEYSIHWIIDNNAFQASIPAGFTKEEMLAYCQLETVSVFNNQDVYLPEDNTVIDETEHSENTIEVSEADLIRFSSLDEFNDYVAKATKGGDIAQLSELNQYYLPTKIPTEYELYKITAGSADIGFWYLPKEYLSSENKMMEGEANQKHFLFISPRHPSTMDDVKQHFGFEDETLIDGNIYLYKSATNILFWEEFDCVMMLYLPSDFDVENNKSITELCIVETITVE